MEAKVVSGEKLPPGFRFHPTDQELIAYYLINKIADERFETGAMGVVDLNKSEPWDLPGKAKMGETEWYFYSLRDRKYPTGVRTNRATGSGYWKTTGKDKEIHDGSTADLAGLKKTLVFYRGRAPRGEKTNWVMHEYRLHHKSSHRTTKLEEWVVCRVFQKTTGGKKPSPKSKAVARPSCSQQPQNIQLPAGKFLTPAEIQRLNKVVFSNTASPTIMHLPFLLPPAMTYLHGGDGSGFSISGPNSRFGNLVAPTTVPPFGALSSMTSDVAVSREYTEDTRNCFMCEEQYPEMDTYWTC